MKHMVNRFTKVSRLALVGLGVSMVGVVAAQAGDPGRAMAAATPTVSAQPVGNGIYINATSNVPVAWEIQITASRAPEGNPPSFGGIVVSKADSKGVRQTGFAHVFSKREPGTTHYYIVKATDAAGQSSYKTGQVRTLNRGLTVTFSKVQVTRDGDPEWYRGDGDLWFHYGINNAWISEFRSGQHSLDDGESFRPNRTRSFPVYNGAKLDLAVAGAESDRDLLEFEFMPGDPRVPPAIIGGKIVPDFYSGYDVDEATAVKNLNFFLDFDHVQSIATETVTFESPAAGKLRFRAEVTLSFNYYV
jgi:hypothetical protein